MHCVLWVLNAGKTHIFMTVRPTISFIIYKCKFENAIINVFLLDGHRFKIKKIVTIFNFGRK